MGELNSTSASDRRLSAPARGVFALGDLTVNASLSSLAIVYATFYLTQVVGLRPALAGAVPLIGRFVDAVTDPLIGRLSDHTSMGGLRRRPYFLIGAIPFGFAFALLWVDPGFDSEWAMFAFYTAVYCALSIFSTVVSVPYLSLIPEMATDYDDRTSLNTYRTIGATGGTFCAIALRPVAAMFGGGIDGFVAAGIVYGVGMALPWFAIYLVTFERPEFAATEAERTPLLEGFRVALRRKSFAQLMALYLAGRVAMDLVSAMLILYFMHWLGRDEEFEIAMFLFLTTTVVALPAWLRFSLHQDKARVFQIGCAIWMVFQGLLVFALPDTPDVLLYGSVVLVGIGFGTVDLMPWAMLGEVIDEDELETGERREGVYNGLFMFLRKLAGAIAVFLVLGALDILGLEQGEDQSQVVRVAILVFSTLVPAAVLASAIWLAKDYPITRTVHERIRAELATRGK